jgi:protein-tyrosine phosphatase
MSSEEFSEPIAVLFVCMGNICRSPTAEAVFRSMIAEAGLDSRVRAASAGTHGYHAGSPPDRRALAAGKQRGFDLSTIRARRVAAEDFESFDYILAMDEDVLDDLRQVAPGQARAHVGLLLDYAPGRPERTVPDPYYGGRQGFERVLDLVVEACAGLVEELRRRLR